ncbi:MAG TPA: glutamate--tRNA ligase, partial [Chitinophagaceae bacterium]|nr:glutamate--tRNA ligase [Chitinophagaceae bacterium]
KQGNAYYAFDTPEELDEMRERLKTEANPSPQYDRNARRHMRNSLTLSNDEVNGLLSRNVPHVVRILVPENETVQFTDMIRGEIRFETNVVDDKVLLKADGMPTYHLAVVVDDHLMQITHAFRGEEWLPSAPVHILLWEYLGWKDKMPQWAHLPLIMGPNGKLSKRDGSKYGFPVFAMNWTDPRTNEFTEGFRERGFLPQAFVNMLAMLGWNDGTEQELFSIEELIQKFSIERVHKGGAKFDFEKAKWFNHEWIKKSDAESLKKEVQKLFTDKGVQVTDQIISLVKDRCTLLSDFWQQASFFFFAPTEYDVNAVKPKWNEAKKDFFIALAEELNATPDWQSAFIEAAFKQVAAIKNIKPGELQLPFRIMLVGGKFGPPVFDIAEVIGKEETISRINKALPLFLH